MKIGFCLSILAPPSLGFSPYMAFRYCRDCCFTCSCLVFFFPSFAPWRNGPRFPHPVYLPTSSKKAFKFPPPHTSLFHPVLASARFRGSPKVSGCFMDGIAFPPPNFIFFPSVSPPSAPATRESPLSVGTPSLFHFSMLGRSPLHFGPTNFFLGMNSPGLSVLLEWFVFPAFFFFFPKARLLPPLADFPPAPPLFFIGGTSLLRFFFS